MSSKKIALFIDADNISAKFGKQILDTLEGRGEIFIRRIYGNWEKSSLHGWNDCILNFSLRAVQQPDYAAGKNATDMSLTIDAMDVLYGGKAEIFVLVSNDSDFTPLAIRLRESSMKVIGMGNAHASNSFRMACDEFIDLDAPAEVEVPAEPKKKNHAPDKNPSVQINLFAEEKIPLVATSSKVISINERKLESDNDKKIQVLHEILHEAAKLHGDDSGFVLLNCAGVEIKSKKLDFNVRDFGYGTLQNFIEAFPELYEVQKQGTIVRYRCLSIERKTAAQKVPAPKVPAQKVPNDKLQQIHDVLHEAAKLHGDEKGFVTLSWGGDAIGKKNLSIKDSGHSTLSKFISAFPDLYEVKGAGTKISYRCLTKSSEGQGLQQVHAILQATAKSYKDLNDSAGFTDLTRAGQSMHDKNISVKNFGYGTLSEFVCAFPNIYGVKKVGKNFYYRCKS